MWIFLSLASAVTLAVVNLTDKRLLDHHLPNLECLYAWVAFALAVYIVGALAIFGAPADTAAPYVLAALASGFTFGVGYALLFIGLKLDEASRAVGISQIYPIFVAILAATFLGEDLGPMQWAAIVLVVLGTIVISLPAAPRGLAAPRLSRGVPASVASGLFLGVGFFLTKLALGESSFVTVFIYPAGRDPGRLPPLLPAQGGPATGDVDAESQNRGPAGGGRGPAAPGRGGRGPPGH